MRETGHGVVAGVVAGVGAGLVAGVVDRQRAPGTRWPPADEREATQALLEPETPGRPDLVDQWGLDSFPASDPPANW